MQLTINTIREFFKSYRRKILKDHHLISAGVLIPIFEQGGELFLILTQRTDKVEHHKGQVSFPGGTMESKDSRITDTALREAEEEIGLRRNSVEVLGLLNDFQTPSGFCITPVVGFISSHPQLSINTAEVLEVFSISINYLLAPKNEKIETHEEFGRNIKVNVYYYEKYKIWGATAAIIQDFLNSFDKIRQPSYKKTL